MLARVLLWRLLGLLAGVLGLLLVRRLLDGGAVHLLHSPTAHPPASAAPEDALGGLGKRLRYVAAGMRPILLAVVLLTGSALAVLLALRTGARRRRCYVRLRVDPYRGDHVDAQAIVTMFEALHKRLLLRWWRRALRGQPSCALEVHACAGGPGRAARGAWLALSCPVASRTSVEGALRGAYPNLRLVPSEATLGSPSCLLRLKKGAGFLAPLRVLDRRDASGAAVDRLITAMGSVSGGAVVQLALTPTPRIFERWTRHRYRRRERALARPRQRTDLRPSASVLDAFALRGELELQHRALFFFDLRVVGQDRGACEQVAAALRAEGAENQLVERGTAVRQGLARAYDRRLARGEGNPLPSLRRGVLATTEIPLIWQLPTVAYLAVPFRRSSLPIAPATPAVLRPDRGAGCLRDALGPVSIHPDLRRQNTAVPGTVEQGKTSYLVATVAEDLTRTRCAVIVLDPKGDAAEAALSAVPEHRECTLLDFSRPTCGFNPLAVAAPADVIADYVVGALRNLFTDADIRASSDRYLRKGRSVGVDGRLEWREWETADEQKRQSVNIVAEAVQFLGAPSGEAEGSGREELASVGAAVAIDEDGEDLTF